MFWIIAFTLCGISFAPILIKKPDIWHCQGIFVQACVLVIFCWSFFEKPKYQIIRNIPLGLLTLWTGLQTTYICWMFQVNGKYDVKHFFVFFNFICLLILYKAIIRYLHRVQIEKILNWLRYIIIITLIYCVFQRFEYSQFFTLLIDLPETPTLYFAHNNPIVGFIGNGTHLSGFLASTIPLFLWHGKREDWLALGLMGLVLSQTSTTIGNPSISGWIIAGVLFFYFIKTNKIAIFWIILLCIIVFPIIWNYLPDKFLSFEGRLPIWTYYLKVISKQPITGFGLGTINVLYQQTPYPQARHLHLEYLQYWVELGAIGLILIINLINSFLHIKAEDKLDLCLKGCVIGFLVSCLFNYPSHLWLPSTWCMAFYSMYLAIKRRNLSWV